MGRGRVRDFNLYVMLKKCSFVFFFFALKCNPKVFFFGGGVAKTPCDCGIPYLTKLGLNLYKEKRTLAISNTYIRGWPNFKCSPLCKKYPSQ
jgi:hypothetical protein